MRDEALDRQQLRLYRTIFEHARDATIVADRDGRILLLNRAARELPEDLIERLFDQHGPIAADLAHFREDLRTSGRATVEVRPDGRFLLVEGRTHGAEHVVVVRDVTAERRLESELRALQRTESMGFLTASVVHDFNNLLTPIVCFAAQLERELPQVDTAREIRAIAERAAGLARQMLSFGRREPSRIDRVSVSSAVMEVRSLLERVAGADVEVELALDGSVGDALLDRDRLDHVLLNLMAHARDAMPSGGRVTLRTADVVFEENEPSAPQGTAAGAYVALTVTDTGVGMTSEAREQVFEHFFTTKDRGPGAGLGLTAVRRFVAESGGFIAVHSVPGAGTTMALYFPRVAAEPRPAPISSMAYEPERGSETVLVVDHEQVVRSAVRAVLENHGYRVLDAATSERAVEIVRTHDGPIDLVITEVIMPHVGGRELAHRIKILRPTRVLFTSGDTDRALERHGVKPGDPSLLRKAFTPADLLRKVREVLDEGTQAVERSCG